MGTLSHCIVLLALCIVVCVAEDLVREKRQQSPYLFHNQQQPRGNVQRPPGQQIQQPFQIPRFQGPTPQGFRPSPAIVDENLESEEEESSDEGVERNVVQFSSRPPVSPTPTPQQFRSTQAGPIAQQQQQVVLKQRLSDFGPTQVPVRRPQVQPQQFQQKQRFTNQKELLTEEEQQELLEEQKEEEPDRLTELLPQSKFSCTGKKTGYYADDGLNCEVFHYCQDNARHSWVCPEGFVFHQVHLICMPPSSENICQQSAQFHFVNDFLYKAINMEEVQRKPNTSLKYADRYYPENYYPVEDEEEEEEESQVIRRPPQPPPQQRPQHVTLRPGPSTPQFRQFTASSNNNQVFHSPEEVVIPLQNRRPTPQPQLQQSPTPTQQYRFQ